MWKKPEPQSLSVSPNPRWLASKLQGEVSLPQTCLFRCHKEPWVTSFLCATRAKCSFCLCSCFPVPLDCLFLIDSQDAALQLADPYVSSFPGFPPGPGPQGPPFPRRHRLSWPGCPALQNRPQEVIKGSVHVPAGTAFSQSKSRTHYPTRMCACLRTTQDDGSQARTSWEFSPLGMSAKMPPASARLTAVITAPTPATGHRVPLLRSAGSHGQTGRLLRSYSLCYLHGDPVKASQGALTPSPMSS